MVSGRLTLIPSIDVTTESFGYLYGFLLGDGHIRTNRNYVEFDNTDSSIIESLKTALGQLELKYKTYKKAHNITALCVYSKLFVAFLFSVKLEAINKKGFLDGFYDAEGHVVNRINSCGNFQRWYGITNTKRELLIFYQNLLISFGIESKLYNVRRSSTVYPQPLFRVCIQKKDAVAKFGKLLNHNERGD